MHSRKLAVLCCVLLTCAGMAYGETAITLQTLLERHLASIGSPAARAQMKSRVAQGTSKYEVINGGAGSMEGKATLVAQGRNAREILKFNNTNYRGEDVLTDGSKVQVSKGSYFAASPNEPKRSAMGDFLYNEAALVREGLFFGTVGTDWPLLDEKYNSAKLSYEGLKSVEGRQLHEVKYTPKKRSDAEIHLYFDGQFRHVMTVTTMTVEPRLLEGGPTVTSQQQSVHYRLEQSFGGFQQVDGVTLPTHEDVKFSAEGYGTTLVKYEMNFSNLQNNVTLDERNFQMK